MKRVIVLFGFFLVVLALPAFCGATMYRYVDENGVVRYTDNLADLQQGASGQKVEVKPKEEPNVYIYGEEKEDEKETNTEPSGEQEAADGQTPKAGKTGRSASDALGTLSQREERAERMYSELMKRKSDLDREFSQLQKQKDHLQQQRKDAKTDIQRRDISREVEALNQHIAVYAEKRKAFNEELERYNKFTQHLETEQRKEKDKQAKGQEATE